jgi:hypothetical protein
LAGPERTDFKAQLIFNSHGTWTYTTITNEMTFGDDDTLVTNGLSTNHKSIRPICHALATRMATFLETEAPTPILKAVQEQTRVALGVIDAALEKYR